MDDTEPLLSPTDPAAVEIVNPDGTAPLVIICDHAGYAVPGHMFAPAGPLGIGAEALQQHIGWDIGAADVARRLATRLGATAVLSVYSRLLIDPNRPLGDPDCIPSASDGLVIPANQNLTDAACEARAAALYWPYHMAVDRHLARLKRAGTSPLLLALHSFTPALNSTGKPRPMHAGVMASRDRRFADALLASLHAIEDLIVAYNEPYSGITHGYCLKMHGLAQGLAHAQIEIRQDLIGTEAGQRRWTDLLAGVLAWIMDDPSLRRVEHH